MLVAVGQRRPCFQGTGAGSSDSALPCSGLRPPAAVDSSGDHDEFHDADMDDHMPRANRRAHGLGHPLDPDRRAALAEWFLGGGAKAEEDQEQADARSDGPRRDRRTARGADHTATEAYQHAREFIRQRRENIDWVRRVRSAASAGVDHYELESRFGEGAYSFVLRTCVDSLGRAVAVRMRDREPQPSGLKSVFDFDGSVEELDAHNREIRRHAAQDHRPLIVPRASIAMVPRMRRRERRASCATRTRGSRRGRLRTCSRGGDSGDDDEPGPRRGLHVGRRSRR